MTCPAVNVGPTVWETLFSLTFNTTEFNPYTDENKFLLSLYFLKVRSGLSQLPEYGPG